MIDVALAPELRTDLDLTNLAWFGVRRCVACVASPPAPRSTGALLDGWSVAADEARSRLEAAGIGVIISRTIVPAALPRRAHFDLWDRLAVDAPGAPLALAGTPATRAPWLEPAAQLCVRSGAPLLLRVPPRTSATRATAEVRDCLNAGLPPSHVVLVGCDYASVRAALDTGAAAVLDASPGALGVDGAVDLLTRYGRPLWRLAMVTIASAPLIDVVAPMKLDERLRVAIGETAALAVLTANAEAALTR